MEVADLPLSLPSCYMLYVCFKDTVLMMVPGNKCGTMLVSTGGARSSEARHSFEVPHLEKAGSCRPDSPTPGKEQGELSLGVLHVQGCPLCPGGALYVQRCPPFPGVPSVPRKCPLSPGMPSVSRGVLHIQVCPLCPEGALCVQGAPFVHRRFPLVSRIPPQLLRSLSDLCPSHATWTSASLFKPSKRVSTSHFAICFILL